MCTECEITTSNTFIPMILGSNKTTVSVATGQNDFYLLYLSIGDVWNNVHCAHRNALVLIGFLAMPKTTKEHASTNKFCQFFPPTLSFIIVNDI
ncbi:hypothetical protein PAXRUDRAFT_790967, partial [Paxillus rubicundulus Ve08.2h10]